MRERSGSGGWRGLAVVLLALGALPIVWTWWTVGRTHPPTPAPVRAMMEDGQEWMLPDQIAVQFKPGVKPDALTALSAALGSPLSWNSALGPESGVARLTVPLGFSAESVLAKLQADPRVEAADVIHLYRLPVETETLPLPVAPRADETEPERRGWKPNDPRYNEQWNFQMVKSEEAWTMARGKGVVVAVIDTGVAYDDTKKGKLARDFKATKFVPGYDFVNRDNLPNDDHGHGTHVAGTIAESTNNNEGVAGLAFEAKIMPIKVLSAGGSGTSADIAEAIRWAADKGANVINMSLGGPFPDKLMRSACEYAKKKGVTIVCAAGNSGREGVGYPAAYPDCIAVSAVGPNRELSFYSSWGKQVAISAPGGDKMQDPDNGGILQNTVTRDDSGQMVDDYFAFQGTSMASPHVAAVAALVVSQGVKDPDDVKTVLQKSAQKAKGPKEKYGAGILDAAEAVKLAGKTRGDGVARFWIVALLFAGCFGIGQLRKRAGSQLGAPFWPTAALAFGLLFPDWLTGYLGAASYVNLIGHSVLIPGALLMTLGRQERTERKLVAMVALGMLLHLGWEFLRGTMPLGPEVGPLQWMPWVAANITVGLGLLVSGLTSPRR